MTILRFWFKTLSFELFGPSQIKMSYIWSELNGTVTIKQSTNFKSILTELS